MDVKSYHPQEDPKQIKKEGNNSPLRSSKKCREARISRIDDSDLFNKTSARQSLENKENDTQKVNKGKVNKKADDKKYEELIDKLDPDYHEKKKAAKDLDFIFEQKKQQSEEDKKKVPYHSDGDMKFYTKENEKKRASLKTNATVINSINKFMTIYEFDSHGKLSKDNYKKVHMQIGQLLRADLSEEQLSKLADKDWARDSKDPYHMTKQETYNSLFELADIWTPDVSHVQYAAFMDELLMIIKMQREKQESNSDAKSETTQDPYSIL